MKLPTWRRHQDEDLDEEIAAHLRMAIADRIARGESPDEAARAVRREFGTAHFVMVVGSTDRARHLGEALEQSSDYGIRLMGFLDEAPGEIQLSKTYQQYPLSRLRIRYL